VARKRTSIAARSWSDSKERIAADSKALTRLLDDQWIFDESMAGSIRPAVASILMKVTNLQIQVLEKTSLEQQIADLQEQVTTLRPMISLQSFTNSISQAECDDDSSEQ
jgi:hypothetical protein